MPLVCRPLSCHHACPQVRTAPSSEGWGAGSAPCHGQLGPFGSGSDILCMKAEVIKVDEYKRILYMVLD